MKKATLIIFKRRLGWYWKLVAANGRKQAIGAEPFSSPRSARLSYERACTVPFEVRVDRPKRKRKQTTTPLAW